MEGRILACSFQEGRSQRGALGQQLAPFPLRSPVDRPVVAELAASPPGGVRPGGNFTLTCRAEAWPPAQISWRAPPGALNIGLSSNTSTLSVAGAMGSHGGCTAEGQLEILHGYGVTEEYCGCPIISDMTTTTICHTPDGHPVKIDKHAAEADGIIVFNRVKPHTHFRGKYESGIMKMMTIGMGKQAGAESAHDTGIFHLAEVVETFGNAVRTHSNVIIGLASVENAYDKCCRVVAMTNEEIPVVEEELQAYAKTRMPRIVIPESDLLLVDYIGKNFSGPGADPNVTGTFSNTWTQGGHKKQRMVFFDLSEESHGNASGVGLSDFTTKRMFDKIDLEPVYANSITAICIEEGKIPIVCDNQEDAIKAAVRACTDIDRSKVRIVRIHNTLHLDEVYISEALLEEARKYPEIEILSDPEPFAFDESGNLFS